MQTFGGTPADITPTPRKNADGSISISYQFTTPSQKKAYSRFMTAMGMLGLSTVTQDLGRFATGEPVRGTQFDTDLPFEIPLPGGRSIRRGPNIRQDVLGFTPMSTYTPEKQAFFDRLSRMQAIRDAANELAQAEDDRIEAVTPPTPEMRRTEEQVEEMQETRQEIERTLPEPVKGVLRIQEIQRELRDPFLSPQRRMELGRELNILIQEQMSR